MTLKMNFVIAKSLQWMKFMNSKQGDLLAKEATEDDIEEYNDYDDATRNYLIEKEKLKKKKKKKRLKNKKRKKKKKLKKKQKKKKIKNLRKWKNLVID